jgi:hypothetical protein
MHLPPLRLAIAALAALALATSASADTILAFSEAAPGTAVITGTSSGGTTTLTTPAGGILVDIGTFGGQPFIGQATETFSTPLTSTANATNTNGVVGQMDFAGTITFTGAVGGPFAGLNLLTATFTGGTLSGNLGGNSAGLNSSQPPGTVTFTSAIPQIQSLIAASPARSLSLSFAGLLPSVGITNNQFSNFTTPNSGIFSTVVPEPTSVVMASISVFTGLGYFGLRRFKARRA